MVRVWFLYACGGGGGGFADASLHPPVASRNAGHNFSILKISLRMACGSSSLDSGNFRSFSTFSSFHFGYYSIRVDEVAYIGSFIDGNSRTIHF